MPDITICQNGSCKFRKRCERFMAKPSEQQSYALFEPKDNSCEGFIDAPVTGKVVLGRRPSVIKVDTTVSFLRSY
jgi:predicted ATP-grasp superfamily ATP-dependent carboligase